MNTSYLLSLTVMSAITFLFPQNKLNFSANSAESIQENGETIKIFKDNVKIVDQNRKSKYRKKLCWTETFC